MREKSLNEFIEKINSILKKFGEYEKSRKSNINDEDLDDIYQNTFIKILSLNNGEKIYELMNFNEYHLKNYLRKVFDGAVADYYKKNIGGKDFIRINKRIIKALRKVSQDYKGFIVREATGENKLNVEPLEQKETEEEVDVNSVLSRLVRKWAEETDFKPVDDQEKERGDIFILNSDIESFIRYVFESADFPFDTDDIYEALTLVSYLPTSRLRVNGNVNMDDILNKSSDENVYEVPADEQYDEKIEEIPIEEEDIDYEKIKEGVKEFIKTSKEKNLQALYWEDLRRNEGYTYKILEDEFGVKKSTIESRANKIKRDLRKFLLDLCLSNIEKEYFIEELIRKLEELYGNNPIEQENEEVKK